MVRLASAAGPPVPRNQGGRPGLRTLQRAGAGNLRLVAGRLRRRPAQPPGLPGAGPGAPHRRNHRRHHRVTVRLPASRTAAHRHHLHLALQLHRRGNLWKLLPAGRGGRRGGLGPRHRRPPRQRRRRARASRVVHPADGTDGPPRRAGNPGLPGHPEPHRQAAVHPDAGPWPWSASSARATSPTAPRGRPT